MMTSRELTGSWIALLCFVACGSSDPANSVLTTPSGVAAVAGNGSISAGTGALPTAVAAGSGGLVPVATGTAGTSSPALAGNSSAGVAAIGGSGGRAEMTDSGAGGVAADGGMTQGGAGGMNGGNKGTGCGTRMGMRGKTSRTVTVSGAKRTFIAYLPDGADPTIELPFVYVFHGATQTGQIMYDMTVYSKLADSEGIAVVFPDGQGVSSATGAGSLTPWNVSDGPGLCGLGALVSNPNPVDFEFMDAIKTEILQDQCVDAKHTFATGFSMGGYFSHHIACDRTDIRAVAPHSGGTLADLGSCKTTHVPIIIFHGTADPLIAANCDDPSLPADPSFVASATLWAKKNGCQATYQTIPTNGSNGSDGSCFVYDGCPPDGQVEMCSFTSLSHAWAGAPVCQACIGEGPNYASATQLQWDFFKKYAW